MLGGTVTVARAHPVRRHERHWRLRAIPLVTLSLALLTPACTAIGHLAYEERLYAAQRECESYLNWQDRQACMQRVEAARKQAAEERRKAE